MTDQNILFTIDLKINKKIITLNILQDDTLHLIVQKFCKNYNIEKIYFNIISQKILSSLKSIYNQGNLSARLNQYIQYFLLNSLKQSKLSQQNYKNIFSAPIKQIKQKNWKGNNNIGKKKKENINNDLTKAYQQVYRKCRNPILRNMAQEYLKQKGQIIQTQENISQKKQSQQYKYLQNQSFKLQHQNPKIQKLSEISSIQKLQKINSQQINPKSQSQPQNILDIDQSFKEQQPNVSLKKIPISTLLELEMNLSQNQENESKDSQDQKVYRYIDKQTQLKHNYARKNINDNQNGLNRPKKYYYCID